MSRNGSFDISRRTLLATAGAFGAASALYPSVSLSQDGKILKIRSYGDIQVLDPAYRLSAPEGAVMSAIYAGLAEYQTGDTWGWKPVAVESLEQLDDMTIAFKLRDKLGFTDGFGQMTAEDVKFSIERVANPANESPYAGDWAALKEVEVKDTLSGLIHLKEKFVPLWTTTIPTPVCSILSKAAVEQLGGKIGTKVLAQSGPYLMTEWIPKQRLVLKRNPDWAHESGAYEEIHIIPIEDPSAAEIGFEAGDLDFTWTGVSSISRLRENPPAGGILIEKPSLAYVWVGMNLEAEPFTNPNIRRAFQHAIDREAVVEAAYFGAATTSTGIVAPGLPGHREKVLYDYDPEKARALLEAEGATNLVVTLDILNQSERLAAAQVVQANLADVGVQCEIKQNDSGTFWTLGDEKSGDYWKTMQMYMQRFTMQPDPSWATVWFTPEQIGVWNWERFNSPEFAELHKQGLEESDSAKRSEIYVKMQDLMDESGCYVFLTHEVVGVLYRDTLNPGLKPDGEPLFGSFKPA
mgnify:CR=1 FL=1